MIESSNQAGKDSEKQVLDDRDLELLSKAVGPVASDPVRRQRMRARLPGTPRKDMRVVRSREGEWEKFLPGVSIKVLRSDPGSRTQSALWRLEPGARIPGHPHKREEECIVLEGYVEQEGVRYGAGDYMLAIPGSSHPHIHSPEGALLFIRGETVSWLGRFWLRASRMLGR